LQTRASTTWKNAVKGPVTLTARLTGARTLHRRQPWFQSDVDSMSTHAMIKRHAPSALGIDLLRIKPV
jgi:hypothetical protein